MTPMAVTSPVAPDAAVPEPMDALLALHRTGELVAGYPGLGRLLRRLSDPELVTAGQLLARLDPDEVLRAHPTQSTMTVAVTGHGTLTALVAPLTAELARHGILLLRHV